MSKYHEDESVKLSRMTRSITEPILRLSNQVNRNDIAYTNEKGMSKYRGDKS